MRLASSTVSWWRLSSLLPGAGTTTQQKICKWKLARRWIFFIAPDHFPTRLKQSYSKEYEITLLQFITMRYRKWHRETLAFIPAELTPDSEYCLIRSMRHRFPIESSTRNLCD